MPFQSNGKANGNAQSQLKEHGATLHQAQSAPSTARLAALSVSGPTPVSTSFDSGVPTLYALSSSSAHEDNARLPMLQSQSSVSSPRNSEHQSFISVSTPQALPTVTPESSDSEAHRLFRWHHNRRAESPSRGSMSKDRLTFVSERSVSRDSAYELARCALADRKTVIGDVTFDNPRDSNLRESVRRIQVC